MQMSRLWYEIQYSGVGGTVSEKRRFGPIRHDTAHYFEHVGGFVCWSGGIPRDDCRSVVLETTRHVVGRLWPSKHGAQRRRLICIIDWIVSVGRSDGAHCTSVVKTLCTDQHTPLPQTRPNQDCSRYFFFIAAISTAQITRCRHTPLNSVESFWVAMIQRKVQYVITKCRNILATNVRYSVVLSFFAFSAFPSSCLFLA